MSNHKNKVAYCLSTALHERGKTQKELAEVLGVTQNTVSYFCTGTRTPNTEQIVKIADYLNISSDYLLGRTDVMTTQGDIATTCKYIGCNDKTAENLQYLFNRTYMTTNYEEYAKNGKMPDAIKENYEQDMDLQRGFTAFLNYLFSNELYNELEHFLMCLFYLYSYSIKEMESYSSIRVKTFRKISKMLDLNGESLDRFLELLDKKPNKNLPHIAELETGNLPPDINSDLSRYETTKALEKLLDKIDFREVINSINTKEEWLKYLSLTEKDLKKIKSDK